MYQLIYLLLEKKLKQVPGIRHIDIYTGQDGFDAEGNPVFNTPAVLIDFMQDWQTTDLARNQQQIAGSFKLHIINFIGDTQVHYIKKPAAQHFIQDADVFRAMQHYSAKLSGLDGFEDLLGTPKDFQVFNSITRTACSMVQEYGQWITTTQTYKFMSVDITGTPQYIAIQPQIELLTQFS